MKSSTKVFLFILLILVIGVIIYLALLGYIPGFSTLLGANKPKDLGVTYNEADYESARTKSSVVYEALPVSTPDSNSIAFAGSHPVSTSWNSAEMTALLNDRPWKNWPISDVQLKINQDGTTEMSGIYNVDKLKGYASAIGVPSAVSDRLTLLPKEAAFYLRGAASLSNNQVSTFDIAEARLGRVSIPTGILLSYNIIQHAYAETVSGELSKYSGKKKAIVEFINEKLAWVSGFFAENADFSDGKLNFTGSLPDKELSVQ